MVEQEGQHEPTSHRLPEGWPKEGAVTFDHVSLAYREDLPLVLREVSFSIHKGEKVGIVGRYGTLP